MNVVETPLPGVVIVEPRVFGDERGFFLETWQQRRYGEHPALPDCFVQDNHSRSGRGVLRGMHLQMRLPQGKLVRVTRGAVWDVAADVNPDSATFGRWFGIELSDTNHRQLYIPPGYAHGFYVLSAIADFEYKCTEYYHADDERGIAWNDADLAIDWPLTGAPILSTRDAANPPLATYLNR
jgi:dTDP-4-dehydrorhamnose 3,5-epimerase